MSSSSRDFSLYLSGVSIKENDYVEIELRYEGFNENINRLLLIGENNGLSPNIAIAKEFNKKISGTQAIFTITFPIWEDGTFRAVIETEGDFIYEPGESHSLVFRGKGVFLDLRKIYHLQKEPKRPPEEMISIAEEVPAPKKEEKKTEEPKKKKEKKAEEIPPGYDEYNRLILKPKEFKYFEPNLKQRVLQVLDYLTTKASQELDLDTVILPDIVRSLKQCIIEENRESVFETLLPVIIIIQKALILSNTLPGQAITKEKKEEYVKEVLEPAKELIEKIKNTEFKSTADLMKREYDDDVHNLKMKLRQYI